MTNWQQKTLGEIIKVNYGKSLPKRKRLPGNYLVFGSNGVVGTHSECLVKNKGLVIGRKGSVGKVIFSNKPFFPIDTTYYVTEDESKLDLRFLFYLLKFSKLEKLVSDVGIPGLNRNTLYQETVSYPTSTSIQKQIAQILSILQEKVELIDKQIKLYDQLKKSTMQKLFSEGLHGEKQKETEIGLIPESWKVQKTGDVAKLKSGGTPSRKNNSYWKGGKINWVKTGEIKYCYICDTEEKITELGLNNSSAKLFPKGSLLMAMYGQGVTRGKVAILGVEAATNQACVCITPLEPENLLTKYLYYYYQYAYDLIRGYSHGAQQKNLSANLIKSIYIPISAIKEQEAIISILEKNDNKTDKLESKRKYYKQLFNSMLHKLMNQEIEADKISL